MSNTEQESTQERTQELSGEGSDTSTTNNNPSNDDKPRPQIRRQSKLKVRSSIFKPKTDQKGSSLLASANIEQEGGQQSTEIQITVTPPPEDYTFALKTKEGVDKPNVKIFVGGLSGETTKDHLYSYFSQITTVVDCFVVYNNKKKPSGFGFVTVVNDERVRAIFKTDHYLNNTKIDCKPALDKSKAKHKEEEEMKRKLFVGGLPRDYPDAELRKHFEEFGGVQKAYVVKDFKTGKTRGRP